MSRRSSLRKRHSANARRAAAAQLFGSTVIPPLNTAMLRRSARALASAEVRAAMRLATHHAIVPRPTGAAIWASGSLWGPRWHGHPFLEPRLLRAMSLTEPQVTREFAHWFSPTLRSGKARRRCFIEAVLEAVGDPNGAAWMSLLDTGTVYHSAEQDPTTVARKRQKRGSRRNGALDLLFQVTSPDEARALVIEAKFDAPTDLRQMSNYLKKTRGRVRNPTYVFLARRRPRKLRSPWRYASWQRVLAAFERRLAEINDLDPSFRLFRSQLHWRLHR